MTTSAASRSLVRLCRDQRGVAALTVAIALPVLFGFAGLAVDVGFWYTIQRYNQSAADVAAVSGAMEKAAGQGYSDVCALAEVAAKANNFAVASDWSCPLSSPASQGACTNLSSGHMCVNNPPLFGPNAGEANDVEVILAHQENSWFASFVLPNVTIDTRAVAHFPNVQSCMIGLGSPLGQGTVLNVNGGGNSINLNIPNCSFISNSTDNQSILLHGNVKINAGGIATAGNYRITGNSNSVSPPIVTGIPPVTDPYGTVAISPVLSGCTPDPGGGALVAGTPYCSLTVSTGQTLTVPAGVYYIVGRLVNCNPNGKNCSEQRGDLTISGGTINGTDVTFVLTAQPGVSAAGSIQITGGSGSLSAPTATGRLPPSPSASAGLLIFQDPNTSAGSAANNIAPGGTPCSSSLSLTGAIYTRNTADNLQGNQTAACSTCTELIAASFTFNGTPALDTSQCSSFGVKTQSAPGRVALAE
jgi:Flp pilus assembly protein TadG